MQKRFTSFHNTLVAAKMATKTQLVTRVTVRALVVAGLAGGAGCASICALAFPGAGAAVEWIAAGLALLAAVMSGIWARSGASEPGELSNQPRLAQLSARLLTIQEEERKNLSRELHDGVGQIITALKMELGRLKASDSDLANTRLDRARALADEALRTIRNVSLLLRPTALDDLGLEAALQWHVEDFSKRTSIHGRLDCAIDDDQSLPEAVKTCVYRTVQEALNNCEKHAGANDVVVSVRQDSRGITVSIVDDGRGVQDHGTSDAGLGILGMRERAGMLGGSFSFESEPGRGARVTFFVPVARSQAEDSVARF
jgi:signal transduction histidine kinase